MDKFLIVAFVIFVLLVLWSLYKKPSASSSNTGKGGDWTVYGTMGCGWTRKQLETLKSKNIKYTFVDCDSQECAGMSAFPVNILPDGTQKIGFTEVD